LLFAVRRALHNFALVKSDEKILDAAAKAAALALFAKVFVHLFQKVVGGRGQRPVLRRFFLITFSLRLIPTKKKWLRHFEIL